MGGGRIDCYIDIASVFSYAAFVDLLANRSKLEANGVQVEIHPVFLGGIMQGSGNTPPWTLQGKAKYLSYDVPRTMAARNITGWGTPPNLFELARTMSPLRALLYIKEHFPPAAFDATMLLLFTKFWTPPHVSLADDANLAAALAEVTMGGGDDDKRKLFSDDDVRAIMEGRGGMRDRLKQETGRALELGAFGTPWIWVTNADGQSEPFFGSDRFGQIYSFLGIAFQDVQVLLPTAKL
ncbi:hypothetical protein RJ55_03025 [Drechmeria coniospora]|nr:hypothetical protein RJ55_03025 [Drechmeria coniospora]